MGSPEMVESARRSLGAVGAFLGVGIGHDAPAVPFQQQAVRRVESAGWSSLWTNDLIGADALVRASLWLGATERIVVGTCIANVWVRPVQTARAAAAQLAQAYPGRFVLGLGVGRPEQAAAVGRGFGSPTATARRYLTSTADAGCLRLLAANGPGMLGVAAEFADGAVPAGASPAATALARTALGPDKLLAVYAPLPVSQSPAEAADTVREHRAAGADHVIVGQPYDTDFDAAAERLVMLAAEIELD